MALELRLYDLLPEIYRIEDKDHLLETFLDAIQALYQEIYDREQIVRDAQDIDACQAVFHQFLAQMLDWQLESTSPQAQKFELRYVPELYDLKGTLKGIHLYALLVLGEYLRDVDALYDDDLSQAPEFLNLVSGSGLRRRSIVYATPQGFPQWSALHQKFSHMIHAEADDTNYTFGTWRPRAAQLIKRLYFMKAARSTSYPYFVYREFNDLTDPEPYVAHRAKAFQSMSDLTGVTYLGQRSLGGWPLGRYAQPVHPELTGVFVDRITPLGLKPLGRWRLGECFHEAHTVLQVR
jgi:phage tail-like protein